LKRLISILLALMLLPQTALGEIILFEDENGKVIMNDDGEVGFLPAENPPEQKTEIQITSVPVPSSTPAPQTPETVIVQKYHLHTPVPRIERALQYGDSGEDVLAAQYLLTELGYYHGKCSGSYLEGTQSAVRRFQKYNSLKETGKLDTVTWDLLFSPAAFARDGSNPYATPSPVPSPTPIPTPEPFTYSRKLDYGSSGALVEKLQRRLLELGFYNAKVSGGYYEVTKKAVCDFQRHNGLEPDGVAGRQTQELLFSEAALPVHAQPRPSPTPQPARYTLMVDVANQIVRAYTYDENGEYTVLVREMICSTGTKKNPTPLGTTIMPKKRARWGYFPTWDSHAQYLTRIDSANAFHSVLYYQADETLLSLESYEALGTPASHGCVRLYVSDAKWIYDNCSEGTIITVYEGEYDPEYTMTLRRSLNMDTLRERPLPQPTATPVYARENWPTEYRTLYRGRQGKDVYMLQMRLRELGYYHGTVTGGYYGGTIKAVEDFQRDHGLSVDGAAGQQTQTLLFSSAVDPTPAPPAMTSAPEQTIVFSDAPITFTAPGAAPTAAPDPTNTPMATVIPAPTPFAPLPGSVG